MKRATAALTALVLLLAPSVSMAATLKPLDADGLNLRAGPGTQHVVVGGLGQNQTATLIGQDGEWLKVRTASGLEAWVAAKFSRVAFAEGEADALVITDALNVRREPALTAGVLTVVKQDQRLRLLEMVGDWWKVRTDSGVTGWVSGQFVKRATPIAGAPPNPSAPGSNPSPAPPPPPSPRPAPVPPAEPADPPPPAPAGIVPVLAPPTSASKALIGAKTAVVRTADAVRIARYTTIDRADSVKVGEKLKVLDIAEGWLKVETPRGKQGWIRGGSVTLTEGGVTYQMDEERWIVGGTAGKTQAAAPGSLVVTAPQGYLIRGTPSLQGAAVVFLRTGEPLVLLEARGDWLNIKSSVGWTGWIEARFTGPAPVQPESGASAGAGLTAGLRVSSPGVLRLDVESGGRPIGTPELQGKSLFVPVMGAGPLAALPVGAHGVDALSFSADGVRVALDKIPSWRVTEQAPGRLSIILQPEVAAVNRIERPDRIVFDFQLKGEAAPRLTGQGSNLFVDLPGAVLGQVAVPPGITVVATPSGVRATVATHRAYALKRTARGIELHLYNPGLSGKTILLDPGHGGFDPGAYSRVNNVYEGKVNLEVALRLRAALAAKGATVLMTRTTDTSAAPAAVLKASGDSNQRTDLDYRARMANETLADVFVSIHHNAGDGAGGTETYYTSSTLNGVRSAQLAKLLQAEIVPALGQRDRGAKDEMFAVTRNTDAPGVLLEIAFIDHPIEGPLTKLPSFQKRTVAEIVEALERFYAERTN